MSHKTIIKICGLTNAQDALDAMDAGADYLGLIFVPNTPRALTIEEAKPIAEAIRNKSTKPRIVGVFQNQSLSEIQEIGDALQLDFLQLHGGEPLSFCKTLPVPVIKTLILSPAESEDAALEKIREYVAQPNIHALLLDLAKGAKQHIGEVLTPKIQHALHVTPHFIAGKLQPENVGSIVQQFSPWGVDIASGVEIQPGKKSAEKMRTFCNAVHAATSLNQKETV